MGVALTFLFISFFSIFAVADIPVVDFNESLGIKNRSRYNMLLRKTDSERNLKFFRNLWQRNHPGQVKEPVEKIPKIIHQIWIGGKPLPKLYEKYANTCKAQHPYWKYKLWTDKDLEAFELKNKDLYDKTSSLPEKADIFRYEILRKHGGLYLDIDQACLTSFDDIVGKYSFFAGVEPPLTYGKLVISNGLIATYPGNKIFDLVLERIRKNWNNYNHLPVGHIASHRSMLPLTDVFIESESLHDKSVIFPPTYFLPVFPKTTKSHYHFVDNMKILFGIYRDENVFHSIKPESYVYHDFFE
ncbi:MAG: glycosyltransferase [Rickettsiales bacterium]